MRVLMLGWEFPPHVSGGLGTACRGLTGGLSRLGVDVLFVVPKVARSPDDRATASTAGERGGGTRVEVRAVDAGLSPYWTEEEYARARRPVARSEANVGRMVVARRGPSGGSAYGRDLHAEVERYARAAEAIARRERFDVVHAHDWMTYPAGIAAARAGGKPLVVHVHASEHDRSGPGRRGRVAAVEQEGFDAADAIVCVSHYTARTIARNYRMDTDLVRVVHNGVAPPPPSASPRGGAGRGEPVVLFLGRVTYQKGPEAFLEAAARVARVEPRVKFVVAGDGDLWKRVVERAARLGLARHVHFTGFLRGADVQPRVAREPERLVDLEVEDDRRHAATSSTSSE